MMNDSTSTRGTIGNWVSHLDETKRGLAKLLARENVTIVHKRAETATFNIKTRELTLPKWNDITVDQYDLLIGHEVGHAKFTDDLALLQETAKYPGLHSYVNVIEDARIERLMKNEYPGLRGSFRRGYADFYAHGPLFQNLKPTKSYPFIDRINLHYKIGTCVRVPFTAKERQILTRIDALRSFREAFMLAKELWNAEKQKPSTNPQTGQSEPSESASADTEQTEQSQTRQATAGDDEDDDAVGEDSDASDDAAMDAEGAESDDTANDTKSSGNQSQQGDGKDAENAAAPSQDADGQDTAAGDESGDTAASGAGAGAGETDPMSETDQQNSEAMKKIAQTSTTSDEPLQVTLGVLPQRVVDRYTRPNDVFVEMMQSHVRAVDANAHNKTDRYYSYRSALPLETGQASKDIAATLQTFQTMYTPTIKYLASEFLRKRTAKLLERVKTSRTGRLNMTKLHAYKFRDDLFATALSLPKGQSHGIVAIIDGSGSMRSVFPDVLQQTLFFASFAKRVNIPFQAYLFQSRPATGAAPDPNKEANDAFERSLENTLLPVNVQMTCLLDTIGSKRWADQLTAFAAYMTAFSHTAVSAGALATVPFCVLTATPLASAMLLADHYLRTMKASRHLDKMTFLMITDGEDGSGLFAYMDSATSNQQRGWYKGCPFVATDRQTKEVYQGYEYRPRWDGDTPQLRGRSYALEAMLARSLQRRHGARVLAIKLSPKLRLTATYGALRILEQAQEFICVSDASLPAPSDRPRVFTGRRGAGDRISIRGCFAKENIDLDSALRMWGLTPAQGTALVTSWESEKQAVLNAPYVFVDGLVVVETDAIALDDEDFMTSGKSTSKGATPKAVQRAFQKAAMASSKNKVFVRAVLPHLI